MKPVGRTKANGIPAAPDRGLALFVPCSNGETVLDIERRELDDPFDSHCLRQQCSGLIPLRNRGTYVDQVEGVGSSEGLSDRSWFSKVSVNMSTCWPNKRRAFASLRTSTRWAKTALQ